MNVNKFKVIIQAVQNVLGNIILILGEIFGIVILIKLFIDLVS